MTLEWWKATAWNAIAAILAIALSYVALSILASFVAWKWMLISDGSYGRAALAIAAAFWIKQAIYDGPFKVEVKHRR